MSAVKKAVKKVGRFVRRHWKKIVIAAAVVFTAGIAAVGTAGFTGAMAAAGGGIKGALIATGSMLKTGVVAIGGTLGIGKGVTAGTSLAASAAANTAGTAMAANAAAGVGTTLANGAAAQALGIGIPAAQQAAGSTIAGGTQSAAASGGAWNGSLMAGTPGVPASMSAPMASGSALTAPMSTAAGAAAPAYTSTLGAAAAPAAAEAAKGGFLNSAVGSALVSGGLTAMSSYMAAKAQEDDEAINALYGISPRDGDRNLTPDDVRFASAPEGRNSWRPRLMYDSPGAA